MLRWTNYAKNRYYQVEQTPDLFGGFAVVHCWGGLGSRLGGIRKFWYPSVQAAQQALVALSRRRHRRGYVLELDVWDDDPCLTPPGRSIPAHSD